MKWDEFLKRLRSLLRACPPAAEESDRRKPEQLNPYIPWVPWPSPLRTFRGGDDPELPGRRAAHAYLQQKSIEKLGEPPSVTWLVVGNVVAERRYGPGGAEVRSGLRLFSANSKVTVCRLLRSPGFVTVVGRHRRSHGYLTSILNPDRLTNLRVQLVRSPHVIAQHWERPQQRHHYGRDREAAEAVLAELSLDRPQSTACAAVRDACSQKTTSQCGVHAVQAVAETGATGNAQR